MLKLLRLRARNWITYESFELPLNNDLIVIRGKNLDATSQEDAANRTGKSIVPGTIAKIFYDSLPQPVKAPKKAKHALRKGTVLSLDIAKNNNVYRLEKYLERTARVRIIEDKRNRGIRLKSTGDAALQEVFPLNEDQFYSTVYIDARRPSLLQYGSDADRFRFFEQVYDLGIYRKLNDLIKPDIQASLKSVTEYDIVRDHRYTLGNKPDIDDLKQQLLRQKEALGISRQKVEAWRSQERRLRLYRDASCQIPDGPEDDTESLHREIDTLSARIDKGIAVQEKARLYAETQETRDKLKKALIPFADITIDPNLPGMIVALQVDYKEALDIKTEYDDNCRQLEHATALLDEITVPDTIKALTLAQLEREKLKAHSRIEFITRLKSVLSGSLAHEKTCPVCANEFTEDNHAAFETRITKNLKAAKLKASAIHDGIRWNKQDTLVKQIAGRFKVKPKLDCESIKKKLEDSELLLAQMRRKAQITRRLNSLPAIEKPDSVENLKELRLRNKGLLDRVTAAERVKQAKSLMASLKVTISLSKIEDTLLAYQQNLSKAEKYRQTLEHTVISLTSQLREAASLCEQIDKATYKLSTLEESLMDQPILDALKHAFGPKGIIKQRTQKLASSFEKALNDASPLIFCEPVSFRLDVTDTQFRILATRNGIEDDVRSFSGQESRAFSLIVMLSLLRFMPSHMRCDTLCLDEIEANMDESSRQIFVEKFIPEVKRFVKKIVIVTPLSRASFFIPGAQEYYAVKQNGKSRLVTFESMQQSK